MIAKNVFGYYRSNAFMSTQDPESNRFEYVGSLVSEVIILRNI